MEINLVKLYPDPKTFEFQKKEDDLYSTGNLDREANWNQEWTKMETNREDDWDMYWKTYTGRNMGEWDRR